MSAAAVARRTPAERIDPRDVVAMAEVAARVMSDGAALDLCRTVSMTLALDAAAGPPSDEAGTIAEVVRRRCAHLDRVAVASLEDALAACWAELKKGLR